jgi:hypothetical protein
MRTILRLASLAVVASLLGCDGVGVGAPTTISGMMTKTTATNPKLAVVTVEGDTDQEAHAALEAKANEKTADNKLAMTSVVKPQADGTYTMAFSGTKNIVITSVYGWDDLDDNDRVNGSEALFKTSTEAQFYLFRKTNLGTREIKADGKTANLASSYDWAF